MTETMWPAPFAASPIRGQVTVPGSKSMANRALLLAALADGPSTLTDLPLDARDIQLMMAALRSLGVRCEIDVVTQATHVFPGELRGPADIDCGLAGTVMRFLPPVAALARGDIRFDGDARARERPMATSISALKELGIEVSTESSLALPFTIHADGEVSGGSVTLDATSSSQFVSALLLPGRCFREGISVHHHGGAVPSLPHIEMTVRMLQEHGVPVTVDTTDPTDATWSIESGVIEARDRKIEPDISNSLPFAAAALVTGGSVEIAGWPPVGLQPVAAVRDLLNELGANTVLSDTGLTVQGTGEINGIDRDLSDLGELVPNVVALCALATGPSKLSGISHIAGHETDRLKALATELNRLGGSVSAKSDGFEIHPVKLSGGDWHTYRDHRMATTGAIIGLRVPDVRIENIGTTGKTFPEFPRIWQDLVTGSNTVV